MRFHRWKQPTLSFKPLSSISTKSNRSGSVPSSACGLAKNRQHNCPNGQELIGATPIQVLSLLAEKGLVEEVTKNRVKHFSARPPEVVIKSFTDAGWPHSRLASPVKNGSARYHSLSTTQWFRRSGRSICTWALRHSQAWMKSSARRILRFKRLLIPIQLCF